MPKSCTECPFLLNEKMWKVRNGDAFHCGLVLNLQCFGGYDEKYRNEIINTDTIIKDLKKINKNCILAKFNKQKVR